MSMAIFAVPECTRNMSIQGSGWPDGLITIIFSRSSLFLHDLQHCKQDDEHFLQIATPQIPVCNQGQRKALMGLFPPSRRVLGPGFCEGPDVPACWATVAHLLEPRNRPLWLT